MPPVMDRLDAVWALVSAPLPAALLLSAVAYAAVCWIRERR